MFMSNGGAACEYRTAESPCNKVNAVGTGRTSPIRLEGSIVISNDMIRQSARELIDRLGSSAIDYMRNRVATMEANGTPQERDQAHRLLTAVEQIVEEEGT